MRTGARSNGRKSAGKGHGRTAGHRPVRGQILLLAKKKSRGVVGDHVGVVGSVCWSWKRLRARAGEVKNSCRFFGSDLPSGPGATGTRACKSAAAARLIEEHRGPLSYMYHQLRLGVLFSCVTPQGHPPRPGFTYIYEIGIFIPWRKKLRLVATPQDKSKRCCPN